MFLFLFFFRFFQISISNKLQGASKSHATLLCRIKNRIYIKFGFFTQMVR